MSKEAILLDTNILIFYRQQTNAKHSVVVRRVDGLLEAGHQLVLAPQCLYEFYAVATRPTTSRNGLGLLPTDVVRMINTNQRIFDLLDSAHPLKLYNRWLTLVETRHMTGNDAHDARLVAWMLENGVPNILTDNAKDFAGFEDVIYVLEI